MKSNEEVQHAIKLHQAGRLAEARALYEAVLRRQPTHFDALHLLGVIESQSRNPAKAVTLIRRAIQLDPRHGAIHAAYTNLGTALRALGQLDSALTSFERAIAIDQSNALAHSNRGVVLREMGRLEAALASYNRAIELVPDFAEAYSNRGNLLYDLRQCDAALASYNRAIALKAGYAEAHHNRAMAFLLQGDFERGWTEFEWRWKDPNNTNILEKRHFRQPLWLGQEPIAGKSILLHCEQGLGDTFQFCRYAKMVADLDAKVILEVQPSQVGVLSKLEGVSQLIPRGSALPEFDLHCPLMSLPLAFKTTLDSIPAKIPYVYSDPAQAARWRVKLGDKKTARIGLVWSGNPLHKNNPYRSFRLAELIPHLPRDYQYFSLQKNVPEHDLHALHANADVVIALDDLNEFSDTAAVCDCMDLIISMDTSVAHLSGAMGKDTWILLAFNADWRWLLNRLDSPWYPSARLYRQERLGEWKSVFEQLRTDLIARSAHRN